MLMRLLRYLYHRCNVERTIQRGSQSSVRDFSLHSGERQTGCVLDDIRKDHLFRYELAAGLIGLNISGKTCNCLDTFCGNGYGTYLLAKSHPCLRVIGIDGSQEAVDQACECYSLPNNLFAYKRYPFELPADTFDYVTCFESLEHIEDDRAMLCEVFSSLRLNGLLMISVPNQDCHPLELNQHDFHFRHYRHDDFLGLIPSNFILEGWYGQNVYEFTQERRNTFNLLLTEEMRLQKEVPGQVHIYILRRLN